MTSTNHQSKGVIDNVSPLLAKRRLLNVSIANTKIALAKEEAELLQVEMKLQHEWVAKGLISPLPRY